MPACSATRDLIHDPEHGPLLGLLLVLTFGTGIADAVTILELGRVFSSNMTGNTVFVGLAAAGAPGFRLDASLIALLSFAAGVLLGAAVGRRTAHRGRLLRTMTLCQAALMLTAVVLAAVAVPTNLILVACGLCFGIQNAAVTLLGVPDVTTSVVTRTLAALLVNVREAAPAVSLRRLLNWLLILLGAVTGAVLIRHAGTAGTLSVVLAVQLAVAGLAALASRRPAAWQHDTPAAK